MYLRFSKWIIKKNKSQGGARKPEVGEAVFQGTHETLLQQSVTGRQLSPPGRLGETVARVSQHIIYKAEARLSLIQTGCQRSRDSWRGVAVWWRASSKRTGETEVFKGTKKKKITRIRFLRYLQNWLMLYIQGGKTVFFFKIEFIGVTLFTKITLISGIVKPSFLPDSYLHLINLLITKLGLAVIFLPYFQVWNIFSFFSFFFKLC